MNSSSLSIGAVYEAQWSADPVRIVGLDESVVMYDIWFSAKNSWGMGKLFGTFSYYQMPRTYFESHSKFLRNDPLTEQEKAAHRPDLPFGFAIRSNLSWYETWSNPFGIMKTVDGAAHEAIFDAPSVFLHPFGPRNTIRPPILVNARNGKWFGQLEMLQTAREIQVPHLGGTRLTDGVGIYRSGVKKRTPSYYIWGAQSRLGKSIAAPDYPLFEARSR